MNENYRLKPSEHIKQRLEALYFDTDADKTNIGYQMLMMDTKIEMVIEYLDDIYDKN